jgi:hypothetical protein
LQKGIRNKFKRDVLNLDVIRREIKLMGRKKSRGEPKGD